jgi:type III secretion protein C
MVHHKARFVRSMSIFACRPRDCHRKPPKTANLGGLAAGAFSLLAAVAIPTTAGALDLPDNGRTLDYAVVDQDLRDVLAGLAAQMGLRINVSSHVHGDVHGRLAPASGADMLNRLGALYQFDWYCDGSTIYISSGSEFANRVLPLGTVSATELMDTLDRLGVTDARYHPRVAPDSNIVMVDGPPRYQELVQQTFDALSQRQHEGAQVTRVFRGTASAP